MTSEFEAEYVELDQLTSADLQYFFETLDTIQLMSILPIQFTYQDWVSADFDPRHYFLWWKTYANIIKRYRLASDILPIIPSHMVVKFFAMNGKNSIELLDLTREQTHKLIAHYCMERSKRK